MQTHQYTWVESYSDEHERPAATRRTRGAAFFYNQDTKVSTWDRPPDLGERAATALLLSCPSSAGPYVCPDTPSLAPKRARLRRVSSARPQFAFVGAVSNHMAVLQSDRRMAPRSLVMVLQCASSSTPTHGSLKRACNACSMAPSACNP